MALLRAHKTCGYVSPTPFEKGSFQCPLVKPLKGLELLLSTCPLKCHLPCVAIEYLEMWFIQIEMCHKIHSEWQKLIRKKKNAKYLTNFYIDYMLK